jgi:WD40 repeat protein
MEFFNDIYSLSFSSDSSKLASCGSDGTAKIWRVADGSLLHVLTGHSFFLTNEDDVIIRTVWGVDFSPDGALLASIGADDTVRVWRVDDGTQVRAINSAGCNVVNCNAVKFSTDSKLLLTVNGGPINVWRVADGRLLTTYPTADATCLAVASNGKYFAYGTTAGDVVLAYMPLVVEITRQDDQIILNWTGGSGLYRIQRRNDATHGVWHNFEPPTTEMSFTNKISREPVFYRVISLPNP